MYHSITSELKLRVKWKALYRTLNVFTKPIIPHKNYQWKLTWKGCIRKKYFCSGKWSPCSSVLVVTLKENARLERFYNGNSHFIELDHLCYRNWQASTLKNYKCNMLRPIILCIYRTAHCKPVYYNCWIYRHCVDWYFVINYGLKLIADCCETGRIQQKSRRNSRNCVVVYWIYSILSLKYCILY